MSAGHDRASPELTAPDNDDRAQAKHAHLLSDFFVGEWCARIQWILLLVKVSFGGGEKAEPSKNGIILIRCGRIVTFRVSYSWLQAKVVA